MIITSAARALYDTTSRRWEALEDWYTRPGNTGAVHLRHIDPLIARWHKIDDGTLTDVDELDGSYMDLEIAETYAAEQGYPLPPGYKKRTVGVTELQPLTSTAQRVDDNVRTNPTLDRLTTPLDIPTCKRIGVPDMFCGTDGFGFHPLDTPWYVWALGAGAIGGVGLLGYLAFKVQTHTAKTALELAPFALPFLAPQVAIPMAMAQAKAGSK